MARKVGIYLRVSTMTQSTENQLRELEAVARAAGWEVVEVFEDFGISGAKGREKRPSFDRMMKAVTARRIDIGFDGYAAGGLAVGEDQATMFAALDATVLAMPEDRPRYLMGVGKPSDLVGAVLRGIDMFDCVLPTRSGRTAQAFTRHGPLNLRNARHADDPAPLDPECPCSACAGYSRAYLHHLCRSGEILGSMLLTAHNLRYYGDLMTAMRAAIEKGTLADFAASFESTA